MSKLDGQVVYTLSARCRDCYRCLRSCPVKAIKMHDGQANVDPERCIACGTCIRECPQEAKAFRSDVEVADNILTSGAPVAVSLAPSFAAFYAPWQQKRIAAGIRKLGAKYVAETSVAAYDVAIATTDYCKENKNKFVLSSACPAFVNFIEKYHPHLVPNLAPIASPMIAHGRRIKKKLGDHWKVIFIGPCIAKKTELMRGDDKHDVDVVLTFTELDNWFEARGINLRQCEESAFDEKPHNIARIFALPEGLLHTANCEVNTLASQNVAIHGYSEIEALIKSKAIGKSTVIEPLFCMDGCINGPAVQNPSDLFQRKANLIQYYHDHVVDTEIPEKIDFDLSYKYVPHPIDRKANITEEQINLVLKKTGKADPKQQLNCSACGYDNCRQKAIAVIEGMADPDICIPYMRRLAEQRTDKIIETSPNGIVVLDNDLNIIKMNTTFRKLFNCTESVLGTRISCVMDPEFFEKLQNNPDDSVSAKVYHRENNLLCHQILYALPEDQQFVGIFIDLQQFQDYDSQLEQLKNTTIEQAEMLVQHQIDTAQKIAQFLGESTAHVEGLVNKLLNLASKKQ